MRDFEVGEKVFYLALSNLDNCENNNVDELDTLYICIKRGIIKRIWKNGRLALENGKVISECYCKRTHQEVVGELIQHVEMLDAVTKEFCDHDFSYSGRDDYFNQCKLCGELKSKI